VRSSRQVGKEYFELLFTDISPCKGISSGTLQDHPGWHWFTSSGGTLTGWTLPMQAWQQLLTTDTITVDQLNRHGNCTWSTTLWAKFWRGLWSGRAHPRTRLVIWRVLHHNFFSCLRESLWSVCQSTCPMCQSGVESITHMFFQCAEVKTHWYKLLQLLRGSSLEFGYVRQLLDMLSFAVNKHKTTPTFPGNCGRSALDGMA
jgi:hypothetical protein